VWVRFPSPAPLSLKPGMVFAAEAFQRPPGVRAVGLEHNFIVTDTGAEVLDKTPILFW
jgi:Xaa-Pro aminopeptidase